MKRNAKHPTKHRAPPPMTPPVCYGVVKFAASNYWMFLHSIVGCKSNYWNTGSHPIVEIWLRLIGGRPTDIDLRAIAFRI